MKVKTQELIELLRSQPVNQWSPAATHRIFRHWPDIADWIESVEARLDEFDRRTLALREFAANNDVTGFAVAASQVASPGEEEQSDLLEDTTNETERTR